MGTGDSVDCQVAQFLLQAEKVTCAQMQRWMPLHTGDARVDEFERTVVLNWLGM
jgi:hypothetical protein